MREPRWSQLSDDELLDVRLCDLKIRVEDTWVQPLIERVGGELSERGLRLRPHFWLSDEWFSPMGIPGVAVPFFLAHPRLMKLERKMMLEVEGGRRQECLRLLRHEVGHAVQDGYQLHRRSGWRRVFGRATIPYPSLYRPRPASKKFVQHLDGWYAQAHPVEDFAETFAVWLAPRSGWRARYAGWPALEKLEFVDELMNELSGRKPRSNKRSKPGSLSTMRYTLREHYERRMQEYAVGYSDEYDRDLLRVFTDDNDSSQRTAVAFLRAHRREIRERVARHTGEHQFTLDQVLKQMMGRCRERGLRLRSDEDTTKLDFALVLAVHTVQKLHTERRPWHAL